MSLVGVNLLGNSFQQDPNPLWVKINNVAIGDSHQYGYKIIQNTNIGQLLNYALSDSNIVCVVYNWATGTAYTKIGFNLNVNSDSNSAPGYTTFIVKSKISNFYKSSNPQPQQQQQTRLISPYSMGSELILNAMNSVSFKVAFTLAFWNSNGWDCGDPDPNVLNNVINNGGQIIISFGGSAGCSSSTGINGSGGEPALSGGTPQQVMQRYLQPLKQYNVHYADFDIEGNYETDVSSYQLRNSAIVLLQQQIPGLKVSFTVPGNFGAVNMIKDALNKGVQIDCIRLMAMDWCAQVDMVSTAINCITSAHSQFPNMNFGYIPLLGLDDQSINTYTLQNHQNIINQLKNLPYVTTLSYWELHLDSNFTYLQAYKSLL